MARLKRSSASVDKAERRIAGLKSMALLNGAMSH